MFRRSWIRILSPKISRNIRSFASSPPELRFPLPILRLSARRGDTYRQRKAACALAVDWSVTGALFAHIDISEREEYWDDLRCAQKQQCSAPRAAKILRYPEPEQTYRPGRRLPTYCWLIFETLAACCACRTRPWAAPWLGCDIKKKSKRLIKIYT